MTCHYPDLSSASDWLRQLSHAAQLMRSTTQIWVVTRHQYEISALDSQTSFRGKTSGGVAKCRLLPPAKYDHLNCLQPIFFSQAMCLGRAQHVHFMSYPKWRTWPLTLSWKCNANNWRLFETFIIMLWRCAYVHVPDHKVRVHSHSRPLSSRFWLRMRNREELWVLEWCIVLEGRGNENGEEHQSLGRRSLSKTGKFLIVISARHLSDSPHVVMVNHDVN